MEPSGKKEMQTDTTSHLPAYDDTDATFDVAKEAIGGTAAELGRGYYRSASFIGTVAASLDNLRDGMLLTCIGVLSERSFRIPRMGSSCELPRTNQ